jgi:hypothetical protein
MAILPGSMVVRCSRCGASFSVNLGHVCTDLGHDPIRRPPVATSPPFEDDMRQLLHDARATLAHLSEQLRAAGNRERTLTATLERLFQFTAGLQLTDQPLAVQREREAIKHAVVAVLTPQCAVNDSMGDARRGMNLSRAGGGGGDVVWVPWKP